MNYEQAWEIIKNDLVKDLFVSMKKQISKGKGVPCSYHLLYPNGKTTDIYVDELLDKKEWKDEGVNKVILMQLIREFLRSTQPDFVIFISEGFTLHIEAKGISKEEREEIENHIMEKYGTIERTPGRAEILMCNATTKYGVQYCKTAQVTKEGDKVKFTDVPDTENLGGRMIMEGWANN